MLQPLGEGRSGVLAEHGERGLRDAACVLLGERPLLQGGQLLGEERIRVGDGLLEGPRESLLQRAAVVRSEDPPGEGVDGAGLVAGAIALYRGATKSRTN